MSWLAAGVALAAAGLLQLGVADGRDGAPAAAGASSSGPPPAERRIRECANRNRRARGLGRLRSSRPLARAARLHARSMARDGYFDHVDPRGRDAADRVALFDRAGRFTYVGENIAAGYASAGSACRGWIDGRGHRRSILDPRFTHVGGGFARGGAHARYYVQVFAAPG